MKKISNKDSAPSVESKGKGTKTDNEDRQELSDNLERIESKQNKQKPPPRKRQRATTESTKGAARRKQVRGKQGRLAGLVNMPIDMFTEIASHLLPGDIISLSRLNKFFRNLLMHRSAIHIWRGAMKNVAGLPACPPGMSEPRYLALLFLKACSMCGRTSRGKINTVLLVQLCGPCRDANLMTLGLVPPILRSLIPYSTNTTPTWKRGLGIAFLLRDDYTSILDEYEEKKRSDNQGELEAWISERKAIIGKRWKQAREISWFLETRELDRERELENAKVTRQSEIKRRLEQIGWNEKDIEFGPWFSKQDEWNDLVSQPKPLTDRIWANIRPKLITLLQSNQEGRLKAEREERKAARRVRLIKLILGIKKHPSFTLKFNVQNPAILLSRSKSTSTVTLEAPFPDFLYTLTWPVVKSLYETDSTEEEMEANFEAQRGEIETLIIEWRDGILSHLVAQVRHGLEARGEILQPVTSVRDNDSDTSTDLSKNLKFLLRADSLFYNTKSSLGLKRPLTYNALLANEGLIGRYDSLRTGITVFRTPPNLDYILLYVEAQEVAQALLADMGKPSDSYLETGGSGLELICGRCHETDPKTWAQLVQHFVEQNQLWDSIQKAPSSLSDSGIQYNNVHNPALISDQPMVGYYSTEVSKEVSSRINGLKICQLCKKIPAIEEVTTSQLEIFRHLRDVHGITQPQVDEHYTSDLLSVVSSRLMNYQGRQPAILHGMP